jgi:hypothetical protein
MYTIINKIEMINSVMTYTAVGYTTNTNDIDTINSNYDSTLGSWIESNKTELENGVKLISDFFNTTPKVHVARTTVSLTGDLIEITNINDL